jgi:hypothetical protein
MEAKQLMVRCKGHCVNVWTAAMEWRPNLQASITFLYSLDCLLRFVHGTCQRGQSSSHMRQQLLVNVGGGGDVEREWLVAKSMVQSRALRTTAHAVSAIVRYRQCALGLIHNFVVEGVFSKIQNYGSACDHE